jgi:hypothetical protein
MLTAIKNAIAQYWIRAAVCGLIFFGGWQSSLAILGYETRKEAYEQSAKGEPFDPAEEKIAQWTVVLGVFTGVLALSTLMLWAAGEKQIGVALKAAEAAKQSADSFKFRERAYLILREIREPGFFYDGQDVTHIETEHNVFNLGATPALIYKYRSKIFFARTLDGIAVNLLDVGAKVSNCQVAIVTHGTNPEAMKAELDVRISREQMARAEAADEDSEKIFVVSSIWFQDVFGDKRTFIGALKYKRGRLVATRSGGFNRHYDGYRHPDGSLSNE